MLRCPHHVWYVHDCCSSKSQPFPFPGQNHAPPCEPPPPPSRAGPWSRDHCVVHSRGGLGSRTGQTDRGGSTTCSARWYCHLDVLAHLVIPSAGDPARSTLAGPASPPPGVAGRLNPAGPLCPGKAGDTQAMLSWPMSCVEVVTEAGSRLRAIQREQTRGPPIAKRLGYCRCQPLVTLTSPRRGSLKPDLWRG